MGRGSGKAAGGEGWALVRPAAAKPASRKPARSLFRIRVEVRRGRKVTLAAAEGVARAGLQRIVSDFKTAWGVGGTWREGEIELQGDHRDRLRSALEGEGFLVKG